jgi:hypothetical protein
MAFRFKSRGTLRSRRKPGERTKVEQKYELHLEARKQAGEVQWYWYELCKFRLADRSYWTPDYMVLLADGTLEAHECKGRSGDGPWMEEDARLKARFAGETLPVPVVVVWPLKGGGWGREEY